MKKLNTIFSFVLLSFCLLINVSFAIEFTSEGIPAQSVTVVVNNDRTTLPNLVIAGNYTIAQGFELWEGVTGNNESLVAYNAFLQACTDKGYTVFGGVTGSSKKLIIIDTNADMGFEPYGVKFAFDEGYNYYYVDRNSYYQDVQVTHHISTSDGYRDSSSVSFYTSVKSLSTNKHVKNLTISNNLAFWDGTYKYDEPPIYLPNGGGSSEPDEPTMPTNAEIAQAVQAFYDSDYYKNNKDFKEFFVLYNSKKGIFSFIGHNCVGKVVPNFDYGSTLSQYVYSPDYPSNIYGLNYWSFNIETLGAEISNFFNNTYWLYSSLDNGETITYNGQGKVTDLVNLKFDSRYSTIIYSSTDYICRVFDYENNEETTTDAVISGDEYTYDENLDPTTNEYNPITDFVPINPSETVLGNVDFDEINKTFEENKGILNIEDASWLFTANNKLISYFIGFLSLLIVFLIISRALGG